MSKFIDRYFGFNSLIGEEVVFYEEKCVWGHELLWVFLQKAFLQKRCIGSFNSF